MAVLRGIRTVVKIVAVVVSIAFALNSVNGVLGAIDLANGNIKVAPINPGDFQINYENLSISVGINVTNPGMYPLEGIIIGIRFQMKTNLTNEWKTILNNDTVNLGNAPEGGIIILPGGSEIIGLNCKLIDFELTPAGIASEFGLNPSDWDLAELLNAELEAQLDLNFTVSYAFGQYKLNVALHLGNEAVGQGLGI